MPKQEYPPLLAQGFHTKTWDELEALCVSGFPLSKTRPDVLAGLRRLVKSMCAEKMEGDLWVDGSFLTEKIDPADADVALRIEESLEQAANRRQREYLRWLSHKDHHEQIKRDFLCDTYVFIELPPSHPRYTRSLVAYWIEQFGFDRAKKVPKGIVILPIPGGVK